MSPNLLAAGILATGTWLIIALMVIGDVSIRPGGEIWIATSSDKVASHPTLVRAAEPLTFAAR